MLNALDLPLRFDPAKLQADLARIQPHEWAPHYNEQEYGGEWRGVALRSASGQLGGIAAQGSSFADTEVLRRCDYFREILAGFECRLLSVRLLSLAPGSFVREHCDRALGFDDGEVRIHIPIETNTGVEFYSCGERLRLAEGGCYYVDVSRPHRVANRGGRDRVHLVIDAEVNDWIRQLFSEARATERIAPPPLGFAAFRDVVLADTELRQALHAISEPREFVDEVIRAGHSRGFEFDAADVEAKPNPLPESSPPASSPSGAWIPIALKETAAEWIYFGARRFTQPFFDDDVKAALQNRFARTFRRIAPLPNGQNCSPSGFILHMSRCGSTLAARMLAALPNATVISEAPILDEAIQTGRAEIVRSAVAALQIEAGPYFIKFDAWHIHRLPLIREAFPNTPWVFLYREPLEVLVSQSRMPGRMSLPGAMDPAILGMRREDITIPRDEWCARVIAAFCESALRYRSDPQGLFVNYRDLCEAGPAILLHHFGAGMDDTKQASMDLAMAADAKFPSRPFQPDGESKRDAAPDALRQLCVRTVNPLYRELEAAAESAFAKI
ncbi:MAG TPA: aspartyl/asparaginyl beta-hydroxylase domain-containing protein [Bryobacteraceae bacterium]|jgi:hypothetical protein